jgi:hypothetical protein
MPTEDTSTSTTGLDVPRLLRELEVPFSPDQVRWRVTNTTNDKKRGQIVPYADSRAYTDRLNALFTPQGWTREYKVETMTNIARVKKGESIVSGKVLVTCTVTILGIGSHSGTGEEWADDDNGMTSPAHSWLALSSMRTELRHLLRKEPPPYMAARLSAGCWRKPAHCCI